MERFVQLIVGGGVVLVAGLWIAALSTGWSIGWLVGTALAVIGLGGVFAGIVGRIDV